MTERRPLNERELFRAVLRVYMGCIENLQRFFFVSPDTRHGIDELLSFLPECGADYAEEFIFFKIIFLEKCV